MMIEIPAGRYGPAKPREVDDAAQVRVELRLPAPMVRELTLRAAQAGLSRNHYVERLFGAVFRDGRGEPGGPVPRDGPHV